MKKVLTVRIHEELQEQLKSLAEENELSVSEFVCGIIQNYCDDNYNAVDVVYLDYPDFAVIGDIFDIKKKLPELGLFLFIYNYDTGYISRENLSYTKILIQKIFEHSDLNPELRFELVKVLNNINLLLDYNYSWEQLHFISTGNHYSLNYKLMFDQIIKLIK